MHKTRCLSSVLNHKKLLLPRVRLLYYLTVLSCLVSYWILQKRKTTKKSLILHHRSSIPKKSREKCPIINTQLSGFWNKDNFTRQLQSTIHCNFNFFNCNLTEVKALSLKLQYFSVNWVLPFIFVSVLQDSIKF